MAEAEEQIDIITIEPAAGPPAPAGAEPAPAAGDDVEQAFVAADAPADEQPDIAGSGAADGEEAAVQAVEQHAPGDELHAGGAPASADGAVDGGEQAATEPEGARPPASTAHRNLQALHDELMQFAEEVGQRLS